MSRLWKRRPTHVQRLRRQPHRRGGVYIIVVGVALIISVLGTAALLASRVHRRSMQHVADKMQAENNARSALRMALWQIANNPLWRQQLDSNTWDTDIPLGSGSYRFSGADPNDDDLLDHDGHPVTITATGKSGDATRYLSASLEGVLQGLPCLQTPLHCGATLDINGDLTVDRPASSNGPISVGDGATLNGDAEAGGMISTSGSGTITGSTTDNVSWPRTMPDTSSVLDYYLANGTTINASDLPVLEMLENGGAESGVSPWVAEGTASVYQSTVDYSGLSSIGVFKYSPSDTAKQDVTLDIHNGATHSTSAYVVKQFFGSANFRIVLRVDSTGNGVQVIPLTSWTSVGSSWVKLEGSAMVSWTGTLNSAEWFVEGDSTSSYRMDEATLTSDEGGRSIRGQMLGVGNNPWGSTNSKGIYIIQCEGEKLQIRDSRIQGTLVVMNAGAGVTVEGSVLWSPAMVSSRSTGSNLPALLSDSDIVIALDSADLDEATLGVNFNPSGSPYQFHTDNNANDDYPSVIKGLVYSTEQVSLSGNTTIHGVVVSESDMTISGSATITYDPVYYHRHAPPGFEDAWKFRLVPGSLRPLAY